MKVFTSKFICNNLHPLFDLPIIYLQSFESKNIFYNWKLTLNDWFICKLVHLLALSDSKILIILIPSYHFPSLSCVIWGTVSPHHLWKSWSNLYIVSLIALCSYLCYSSLFIIYFIPTFIFFFYMSITRFHDDSITTYDPSFGVILLGNNKISDKSIFLFDESILSFQTRVFFLRNKTT